MTWLGCHQNSHRSRLHNCLFEVGTGQVERPEMHRGALFLKCRNHVHHRVLKISKFHFINEVKLNTHSLEEDGGGGDRGSDHVSHCTEQGSRGF